MNDIERADMEIAAGTLEALYSEMHADLDAIEQQICGLDTDGAADAAEQLEMRTARTALHSGMASIQEVLGWLLWVDPEAAVTMRPLPSLRSVPVH